MGPKPAGPHLRQPVGIALLIVLLATDLCPPALHPDAPQAVATVFPLAHHLHERSEVVHTRHGQAV